MTRWVNPQSRFSFSIHALLYGSCLLSVLILACGLRDDKEDKVALMVGSRAITAQELKKGMAFISAEMNLSGQQGDQLTSQLLEQLIDHYLIIEYAKEKGISISEKDLESAVKDIKKEYTSEEFGEALLRGDVDFEEWKGRLREQLLINKIMKELTESLAPPSYQDIRRYFQESQNKFRSPRMVRFRQIVTRTKEEGDSLLKRLHNGEDMGELARKYSIAPEAENGGEVGWMAQEHLEQSMEKVLFSMSPDKISPVISTPYGYHIFQVLAVQPERVKELPEVIQEIESLLLQQRREVFYENWLLELRALFEVRVNQDLIDRLELS